jgi:rRNA maturation endonuclease Nob1
MKYYECIACDARFLTQVSVGTCENCGGQLSDISVPRE